MKAEDVNEKTIRHLEMIQGIINRMGSNSFAVKAWAVGLVSAVLVLAGDSKSPHGFPLIALLPAVVFWMVDAYYLRQERLFRHLYNDVRGAGLPDTAGAFSMSTKAYEGRESLLSVAFSVTLWPPYAVLVAVVLIAFFWGR